MIGVALTLLGDNAFSQTKPFLQFAIAAQPLAAALDAYSTASGLELFYDGELAIGRHSSAVVGLRVPEDALREQLVQQIRSERATVMRRAYLAELLKQNPPILNELALSSLLDSSRK